MFTTKYKNIIAYHYIDGELSYCIEPNVTSYANQTYSGYESSEAPSDSYWMEELDATQRKYIQYILAFGYPDVDYGYSEQVQYAATQVLIWEVVMKARYMCTFSDLVYSVTYTWTESAAPKGYLLNEENTGVWSAEENEATIEITCENFKRPGFITVAKQNSGGDPLSGCTFLLEYLKAGTWTPVASCVDSVVTAGQISKTAVSPQTKPVSSPSKGFWQMERSSTD